MGTGHDWQDWHDRQDSDSAYAKRVSDMDRFTSGLSAEDCKEIADRWRIVPRASEIQRSLIGWIGRMGPRRLILPNVFVLGSPWEADVVSVTPAFYWYEYEIKVTIADYRNDFSKTDTYGKQVYSGTIFKHEAYASPNEIVQRHGRLIPKPKEFYFVVPAGLLDKEDVPEHCGILEYGSSFGGWNIHTKRPAPQLKRPTKLDRDVIFNLAMKASDRLCWQKADLESRGEEPLNTQPITSSDVEAMLRCQKVLNQQEQGDERTGPH